MALSPTQIMFISVMLDTAIRRILDQANELSEEELLSRTQDEQARKKMLMDRLDEH